MRKVSGSNPLMSTNSKSVRNDGIFSIFKTFKAFAVENVLENVKKQNVHFTAYAAQGNQQKQKVM